MALFNNIAHNNTIMILSDDNSVREWNRRDSLFDGRIDPAYAVREGCTVYYIANAGFCVLNRKPRYGLYARLGIPEIQDVYVVPSCRRQGIASRLIRHCEAAAGTDAIGISVPVGPAFGPAQRLYAMLGYMPDGNGVTCDREAVTDGRAYPVDDLLCLMLVKSLRPS